MTVELMTTVERTPVQRTTVERTTVWRRAHGCCCCSLRLLIVVVKVDLLVVWQAEEGGRRRGIVPEVTGGQVGGICWAGKQVACRVLLKVAVETLVGGIFSGFISPFS